MSSADIDCAKAVNNLSFAPSNNLLVEYSDGALEFFSIACTNKPPKFGLPPKSVASLDLSNHKLGKLRLHTFVNEKFIYAVEASPMGEGDSLVVIEISDFVVIEDVKRYKYKEKILRIATYPFTGAVYVQATSGTIFVQKPDDEPVLHLESFNHGCPVFAACQMADEDVVVGITQRGILYVNGNVAASNCSSFALHNEFLLTTTYANQLRCIPLSMPIHEALDIVAASPSSKNDDTFREVERGSKIVCAVPNDIKVVLQMPRGNLEGIYPRALVLSYLRHLLTAQDYKEAVTICRKYKIDMNLIFDHDPAIFLKHTDDFVTKVVDPDFINLFLSSLNNQDITQVRYPNYFTRADKNPEERKALIAKKVSQTCKLMRESLQKLDQKKFISSILTTFARDDPPQLEQALEMIRAFRIDEIKLNQAEAKPLSEKALEYLIFLADVNKLFDLALGMYDFELTMMVAQKSQKDPKEYLPFIAGLKKLEKNYQRYTIDMHLERYESALNNLSLSGEKYTDDCLKLIKEKGLYALGIKLFAQDKLRLPAVYAAYGYYLVGVKKYKQAAFAYIQGEQLEQAQDAFKLAGAYKFVFSIAKQLKQTKEQVKTLGRKCSEVLQTMGKLKKAATVLKDYAEDTEEAISTLMRGDLWEDALRFASLADRNDLIQTHIKPGTLDAYRDRLNDLVEAEQKIGKYVKRLKELRVEKQQMIEAEMADDGEAKMDNSDAFSDTMSLQSQGTNYSGVSVFSKASTKTNATQKSQKWKISDKSRKKKQKLRKGAPNEEQNIVQRLDSLIPSQDLQKQIGQLLHALIYFGHLQEAKELQAKLHLAIQTSIDNKQEMEMIFTPLTEGNAIPQTIYPKKVADILGNVDWKVDILE